MGIGDSITIVSCLGGTMLASAALLLFFNLVFPRITHRGAMRLKQGVIIPFFVGLVPTIFLGIPSAILLSIGSVFQFCGTLLYLFLFSWAFLGLATVSQSLGMRLGEGYQGNALTDVLSGVLILMFAIAFPIIGWLVIFPLSVVIGVGATILALGGLIFKSPPEKRLANTEV